jgi:hypothetical protein
VRLLAILMLSLLPGTALLAPSLAAADCAGHEVTASTPSSDTVAEVPAQTDAPTSTKTTITTTPTGG